MMNYGTQDSFQTASPSAFTTHKHIHSASTTLMLHNFIGRPAKASACFASAAAFIAGVVCMTAAFSGICIAAT